MQLESLFDIAPSNTTGHEWAINITLPEKWNVGLIVGPSGSGKTTLAREIMGDHIVAGFDWPKDKAIVDGFPASMGIKDITRLLSSVGFSSPPSWLRPFHVLSNGEQFRVTMARALAERKIVAIDEFTSVVDRTVARIGANAIGKTVRRLDQQFIAIACHYDIVEWLQPDWIYQPHLGKLDLPRGRLRRPPIKLEIRRVHSSAWNLFKQHHYLSAKMNKSATCFCAFTDGIPVAFCAWLPWVGKLKGGVGIRRASRIVCLPDYQGASIGSALFTHCAAAWRALGYRVTYNTGHPGEIAKRMQSSDWSLIRAPARAGKDAGTEKFEAGKTRSLERNTASFEYIGKAIPLATARELMAVTAEKISNRNVLNP